MCYRYRWLREQILEKEHGTCYSIHQGSTKMYHDPRELYWWERLKRDIAEFVVKCTNFQKVKAENLKSGVLLQQCKNPKKNEYAK